MLCGVDARGDYLWLIKLEAMVKMAALSCARGVRGKQSASETDVFPGQVDNFS